MVVFTHHAEKEMYRAGLESLAEHIEAVRTDPDNAEAWPKIEDGIAVTLQLIAYYVYPGHARFELPEWVQEWEKQNGGGWNRPS